jgi:hypothetical protein
VKTARPLTPRQWFKGVWCGITGVPFEIYEADVKASLVEEAAPVDEGRAKEKRPSRTAERKLVEKEAEEQERVLDELKAKLPGARGVMEDLRRRFSQLKLPPLFVKVIIALCLLALVLLLADAGFTFQAFADALGVDLAAGLAAASLAALLGAGGGTFVAVVGNAFCGSAATAEDPPLLKLWGRLGLAAIALFIGLLRGFATADPGWIVTGLNVVLSVVSGVLAGKAHHAVAEYFHKRAERHEIVRAAREPVVEAERNLAELERQIAEGVANRKRLALALDGLDAEPFTQARSQAQDNEELRKIQEARLAQARLVYESAAKFARGRKREGAKNA